jgi:hypothetical protein
MEEDGELEVWDEEDELAHTLGEGATSLYQASTAHDAAQGRATSWMRVHTPCSDVMCSYASGSCCCGSAQAQARAQTAQAGCWGL